MQTGENSIIEARILYYSTVTRIVFLFKIQVCDVMVEYNN